MQLDLLLEKSFLAATERRKDARVTVGSPGGDRCVCPGRGNGCLDSVGSGDGNRAWV